MNKIINLVKKNKWEIIIVAAIIAFATMFAIKFDTVAPVVVAVVLILVGAFAIRIQKIRDFIGFYEYPILIAVAVLVFVMLIILFGWITAIVVAIIAGLGFFGYSSGLCKKPILKWVAVIVIAILLIWWLVTLLTKPRTSEPETTTEEVATTTEEETTTEEVATTTEEETTTSNVVERPSGEEPTPPTEEETTKKPEEETTKKLLPTVERETAEPETTLKNQDEIASSKREELKIPEGVSNQGSTVQTTVNNAEFEPSTEEQTTTHLVVKPIEKPTQATTAKPTEGIEVPKLPDDFYGLPEETTTKKPEETTKKVEETTTSNLVPLPTIYPTKSEEETTTSEEETTTVQISKAEADITVSYTKGASVANVFVTLSETVEDVVFKVWWYTDSVEDFGILQHNELEYTLKVDVPENYKGKLIVGVYEEDGTQLKRKQTMIFNK